MSAIPESEYAYYEYTLPVKAGQITGDERLPVAIVAGVAAAEINLAALIGSSPGALFEFEVRAAGPAYIGMNKSATSGVTITAGVASLGRRITSGDAAGQNRFWVSRDMPFLEVIADLANTNITYRKCCVNFSRRNDAVATGH